MMQAQRLEPEGSNLLSFQKLVPARSLGLYRETVLLTGKHRGRLILEVNEEQTAFREALES